jgi:hypothetical protein
MKHLNFVAAKSISKVKELVSEVGNNKNLLPGISQLAQFALHLASFILSFGP